MFNKSLTTAEKKVALELGGLTQDKQLSAPQTIMLWNVPISLRMGQILQQKLSNAETDLKETQTV
jgi:hypothetical protein